MKPSSQNFKFKIENFKDEMINVYALPSLLASTPTILSIPVAIFCVPILLGYLDKQVYGLWILIGLLINQSHVLLCGAEKSVIILNAKRDNNTYLVCSFLLSILISAVLFLSLISLEFLELSIFKNMTPQLSFLFSIGVLIHLLWSLFKSEMQLGEQFGLLGILSFLHLSSAIFIPSMVIYFWSDNVYTVTQLLTVNLLFRASLLLVFINSIKSMRMVSLRKFKSSIKEVIKIGRWFGLSQCIQHAYETCDRMIISFLYPMSTLPIYNVPLQLSQKLASVPQSISVVLFSKISKGAQLNELLLGCVSVGLGVCVTVLSKFNEDILVLWLGSSFASEMVTISTITLYAMTFASINFILLSALEAGGFGSASAKTDLLGFVPFLIIMAILVYLNGIIGAAIGLILREFIILIFRSILVRRYFGIKLFFTIPHLLLLVHLISKFT